MALTFIAMIEPVGVTALRHGAAGVGGHHAREMLLRVMRIYRWESWPFEPRSSGTGQRRFKLEYERWWIARNSSSRVP